MKNTILFFISLLVLNLQAGELPPTWKMTKQSEEKQFNTILKCISSPMVGSFMNCNLDIFRLQKDKEPEVLTAVKVLLKGGMPAHQHGLPTSPIVTWSQPDNTYIIEGLKFSMSGDWFLSFYIIDEEKKKKDEVIFEFKI